MAIYYTICYRNILFFFLFFFHSEFVNVKDRSLEVINLIRVLNGISRFWGELYNVEHYQALVTNDNFKHKLLTDKVNRQLTV